MPRRHSFWGKGGHPSVSSAGRAAAVGLVLLSVLVSTELIPLAAGVKVTGEPLDLAIQGPGYFLVRDPNEPDLFVTREASLHFEADTGCLVTDTGLRLQGFPASASNQLGDLRIPFSTNSIPVHFRPSFAPTIGASLNGTTSVPPAHVVQLPTTSTSVASHPEVDPQGGVWFKYADGTAMSVGQIVLQHFNRPERLERIDVPRTYLPVEAAEGLAAPQPPGSQGLGLLQSGVLEAPDPTVRLAVDRRDPPSRPLARGHLAGTQSPSELAILGEGYFIVRDPATGASYATRAGAFLVDRNGYLVTYTGCRLQGYANPDLTEIGDLLVDEAGHAAEGAPEHLPPRFFFDRFGKLRVILFDGTTFVRSQVLLQLFRHPERLQVADHSLYSGLEGAEPVGALTRPLRNGAGAVFQGALELAQLSEATCAVRQTLNSFSQGQIDITDTPTDVYISGAGFFVLRRPGDGALFASREGRFHADLEGYLADYRGLRLQGFNDPALTHQGDLRVEVPSDQTNRLAHLGSPSGLTANVTLDIGADGKITQPASDGTPVLRGQILLQAFRDPQALIPLGNRLYANILAAAPVFTAGVPKRGGLGSLQAGALELEPAGMMVTLPPNRTGFRLSIQCAACLSLAVEASSDLRSWRSLGLAQPDALGTFEFVDPETASPSLRFYRVINRTFFP